MYLSLNLSVLYYMEYWKYFNIRYVLEIPQDKELYQLLDVIHKMLLNSNIMSNCFLITSIINLKMN